MILVDVNVLLYAHWADPGGNLVSDAYHAALAIETGATWITTDRDYARFPGLKFRHPLGDDGGSTAG